MIARFPGTCACGCRRSFATGDQVERRGAGWARVACVGVPASPGGAAEILEILARARAVADRVLATEKARAGGRP